MYIGALMPPSPINPIKSPCPTHKGQGGPSIESVSPIPISRAPKMTVQRVPTLSASRPISMPPTPEPNQASALASAGIERIPSTSAAISFRATAVIHAAPNAISMVTSAAVATAHDLLDSTEDTVGCNIRREVRLTMLWQAAASLTTHACVGLPCLLHCAKMRGGPTYGNFLLGAAEISKLTRHA